MKTLTDSEKRRKIAKICGWAFIPTPKGGASTANWRKPNGHYTQGIPNYLNSLDAMHEAEKRLSEPQAVKYYDELQEVVSKGRTTYISSWIYHAAASQRVDAFLAVFEKETK